MPSAPVGILKNADGDVCEHYYQREDGVERTSEEHQQQAQDIEDVVDEAKDVFKDNLAIGATGDRRRSVDLAARLARRHLVGRQPADITSYVCSYLLPPFPVPLIYLLSRYPSTIRPHRSALFGCA